MQMNNDEQLYYNSKYGVFQIIKTTNKLYKIAIAKCTYHPGDRDSNILIGINGPSYQKYEPDTYKHFKHQIKRDMPFIKINTNVWYERKLYEEIEEVPTTLNLHLHETFY
jgi:hypothetical protein